MEDTLYGVFENLIRFYPSKPFHPCSIFGYDFFLNKI